MEKKQIVRSIFLEKSSLFVIFSFTSRLKILMHLGAGLVFLLLPVMYGCGKATKQKRTKSFTGITTCVDSAFEPRKGICVRKDDQCPQLSVKPDLSCKQLPCSPGLYFDGFFCLSEKPSFYLDASTSFPEKNLGLFSHESRLDPESTNDNRREVPLLSGQSAEVNNENTLQIDKTASISATSNSILGSYVESCLANLTYDQKISFLAIFAVAENFLDPKEIAKKSWETRCLESYAYLSRMRISRLQLKFADITDVSPLGVFEYLPRIEKIVFAVTPNTTMNCPLTDQSRCIFFAWR